MAVFNHIYGVGMETNISGGTAVFTACVWFLASGFVLVRLRLHRGLGIDW